jgi:hypothetical protein
MELPSTKRSCDWLIGVPLTGVDGFVTDHHVRILFWVPQVLFLFAYPWLRSKPCASVASEGAVMIRRLATLVLMLAASLAAAWHASAAPAAEPGPAALVVACTGPFARDADRAGLADRFGKENLRDEEVGGAEGDTSRATVLYPDDPRRRLEITWWDEAGQRRPATIRTREEASDWTVGGIGIGAGLADVAAANGAPIILSGFGWDYGGLVTDWGGGKLASAAGSTESGCRLQMGFSPQADAPDAIMGDGVVLRSDEAAVLASRPAVVELGIGWPEE